MAYFRVNRSVRDDDNGVAILPGQYIECNNSEWISRMGKALSKLIRIPEGVKVHKIRLPDTMTPEDIEVVPPKTKMQGPARKKIIENSENK